MYLKDKTSKISIHQDYHTKIVVLKNLKSLPFPSNGQEGMCSEQKRKERGWMYWSSMRFQS